MRLTADNTAVVLDSTSDFPEGPDRFENWRLVPLTVHFGAESFRDHVELTPEEFYARLAEADELPTTSQPPPGDFAAVYEDLARAGYERVISLHIAGKLSGTVESARTAAAEKDGLVRVYDTGTASAAIALLALAVQRRLERGSTDEDVDELVARHRKEAGLLFTVDTLEYLRKGGRIGRAAAVAGELLHVKPILTIDEGEVVPLARVRGNRKAVAEFARRFREGTTDEAGWRVGIVHAAAPERLETLERLVRDVRPRAEIEAATALGPVAGTHAGPGTAGLFWFYDA